MSGILSMLSGGTYSTKPDAPTIGTATATSTTTATVSFTAPAKDGGASITSYTATSSPGGVIGTLSQSGSGTITVSGLTTGTAYTFTVTATNSVGTSTASSASNSITTYLAPANTVAPVVSGTATRGQTLSSTTGTWNGIPTPTFGYQWQRAGSNISGATSSTYTLVSDDVGNAIRCVVTATNVVSAVSANSNVTAAVAAQVPSQPTGVSATATSPTTATLSFTPSSDTGGAAVTYSVGGGGSGSSGSSPINVTGLSEGTTYNLFVAPTNSAGSGTSSGTASVTTPLAPPTTIGQAYGGGYYAGQISTNGNGTATHYLIVSPRSTGDNYNSQWKSIQNSESYISQALTTSGVDGPGIMTALLTPTYGGTNQTAQDNGYSYQALEWAKNRNIGGYTDWYVPAKNELEVMYYNLKPTTVNNRTLSNPEFDANNPGSGSFGNKHSVPQRTVVYDPQTPAQTSVAAFQDGGAQYIGEDSSPGSKFYWSASQYGSGSSSQWIIRFNSGTLCGLQGAEAKTAFMRTRVVRRVPI